MIDTLLIGYNDVDFDAYVSSIRGMGTEAGAYRDLNLAFVTHEERPYRSMDLINRFRSEGGGTHRSFSNVDFLWPVITYLYTYLTRRGFTVEYVNLFQRDRERLIERLESGEVKTVVITTTLYVWLMPIVEIVEMVRQHSEQTRIIVGGPYVHNQATALDRDSFNGLLDTIGADVYVISPEGESTLAAVLRALKCDAPLASINNLAYRDGDTILQTPQITENNDLAGEMVDYTLFPPEEYNGFVNLRTAKSCPFACAFCAFPERAGRYTYLPPALVEKELDAIRAIGSVSTLTFIDDTFNVPKERFKEILRLMIRKNYGFRWNSYLRADHVDDECIELMGRSNCEGVFLGIESGSDRMLKAMNKTARREHYLRVIPRLRDVGIIAHANLIIGFPGETNDTVAETVDLLETARPDFFRAQLWYCDPTTPVWRKRNELGIAGTGFGWSHPTMTAAAASAWVEHLFVSVQGSTWLPQYGFEPWSLYYLQRRGMELDQIKTFIRSFNAAVRIKLQEPRHTEVPAALLSAMRAACQFDDQAVPCGTGV